MTSQIRFSLNGLRVLGFLGANPEKELSGSQISSKFNLPSGTIYPLLARLEGAGFLTSKWEKGNPKILKRPLRRFYKITANGRSRYKFEASRNP